VKERRETVSLPSEGARALLVAVRRP